MAGDPGGQGHPQGKAKGTIETKRVSEMTNEEYEYLTYLVKAHGTPAAYHAVYEGTLDELLGTL